MDISDEFTAYHQELLESAYDCVDRIVVNAYYPLGQRAGGFRTWWRQLTGSDETLDRAHLERMAGRFKRRLQAYAEKHNIPFIHCETGERKHEKADEYLPSQTDFKGLFVIFVGRAPAPVWEVERSPKGVIQLSRKKKWPYVNHYYFHLMDPDWGHITIRMCGYPPFGAQVIANGHEWVERQARNQSLSIYKEDNCFTGGNDFQTLNQIAKTLCAMHAIGRLTKVCDRWLYSSCLCFALDLAEQERTQFHYQYSIFQLEYSRNLLFRQGCTLDEVYEKLLDRTRGALDVKTLRTIFGRKHRPHNSGKRGSHVRLEKVIERPSYDLTVFKLHFGKWTLKIYDKGDRVLRVEIVAHNVKALHCRTGVESLPELLQKMRQHVTGFLNVVQTAHILFLDEEAYDALALPSQRGSKRLAGIDLNKSRTRKVAAAIVALSPKPGGFTTADLALKVQEMAGWKPEQYNTRRAAYDLSKFRAKDIAERANKSRRYVAKVEGIRKLCAYTVLRENIFKPIMAGAGRSNVGQPPKNSHPIDIHYQNLLHELKATFQTLGLTA